MINLRYHIVSLTAVFLAIGIGLTLGSTFLDRATVENLRGQLENLETRLGDRESEVNDLEARLDEREELQAALDEQGPGLLADRLLGVPVAVVTSRGVDEDDVEAAVQALVSAGAQVQGVWWFTDRWALDDESEIDDLATALDETTTDPSRLRRAAIETLGGALRARQLLGLDLPEDTEPGETGLGETGPDDGSGEPEPDGTTEPGSSTEPGATTVPDSGGDEGADTPDSSSSGTVPGAADGEDPAAAGLETVAALSEIGFIDFDDVADGPDEIGFPAGTRILFIGGSQEVPDDLVVEPLVERMGRASTVPILGVASSAMRTEAENSDLVTVVRESESLRDVLPTVDDLEHFEGWAAMVVALADVADGVVGHYGVAEDATRLLPPLRSP